VLLGDAIDDRDEGDSVWPAFADLLAATTLLFLVLFAVVALPALIQAKEAGNEKLLLEDVRRQLESLAKNHRVTVESGNGYIIVRIADDATFPIREYTLDQLRPEGRRILADFAATVGRDTALMRKIEQIQIVGHTSGEGEDEYNWRLSAQRAVSVSSYLISKGLSACKVTALGRGRYYPIDTIVETKNRRIELEIHPIIPSTATKASSRQRCVEARRHG
jgi:outer membrane protein OmpA-like peptidoglycan-associated protein